ncbi:unnamed protein product [Brassica oleracea var. botrytis]
MIIMGMLGLILPFRGKGKEVVAVCLFFDSSLIAAACSVCEGRLVVKELHSYEKEVERETGKTAAMKDKGAHDPYDLKQQAKLEEKEGPEVEDAKKTVAEVEKQFPTEDA